MSLLAPGGELRRSVIAARERGVLFDVGHGMGAFSFSVAESMLRAGFPPDVISSDMHQHSVVGPGFDLPTCMSKFLALGMSLEEVTRAVTTSPAQASRDAEVGSLEVGKRADLALFKVEEGDFVLFDTYLEPRHAERLLVNQATFAAGTLLPQIAPRPPAPWISLTDQQRTLLSRDADELRRPWATLLTTADCFTPVEMEGPPTVANTHQISRGTVPLSSRRQGAYHPVDKRSRR
jgi:dihydroorotase